MPEYSLIEIDKPEDWIAAEDIMKKYVLRSCELDFTKIKITQADHYDLYGEVVD